MTDGVRDRAFGRLGGVLAVDIDAHAHLGDTARACQKPLLPPIVCRDRITFICKGNSAGPMTGPSKTSSLVSTAAIPHLDQRFGEAIDQRIVMVRRWRDSQALQSARHG